MHSSNHRRLYRSLDVFKCRIYFIPVIFFRSGIFRIEDSARVARLWGERKNRPAMNYDKLSRSIRQYYKKGIIRKTCHSKRLVYQFCPKYIWTRTALWDRSRFKMAAHKDTQCCIIFITRMLCNIESQTPSQSQWVLVGPSELHSGFQLNSGGRPNESILGPNAFIGSGWMESHSNCPHHLHSFTKPTIYMKHRGIWDICLTHELRFRVRHLQGWVGHRFGSNRNRRQ